MGSAGPDESSQKAVEPELFDVGTRLLRRPSSTDELLILLEKAESLLTKVWQQPPMSTCGALLPVMKSLLSDDFLRHDDVNIQVALASCFNELTRITAPDFTYADEEMRVIFQLFMVAFEQLSRESGRNYYRALQIVETMAKVRSFLMLLDVSTDELVVKMFQLFLKNIRSNHPADLFKYMEMIMTMVIEESDEISFELLTPLLASVKMDNKVTKPISWELGKNVFKNCATKLQSCLRDAVKAMNLDLDDYAEIVASICHDKSMIMVSKEVAPTAVDGAHLLLFDGLSKAVYGNCAAQTDDGIGTNLDDEPRMEMSKARHEVVHSGTDEGALRKRRGRKPNSVIRPEEGYDHAWKTGVRYSHEASPDDDNEEIEDMDLPSDLRNSSLLSNSSLRKADSSNEVSIHRKGQLKKKESTTNQHNDLESTSTLQRKILKRKERDRSAPAKTGKRAAAGSSNIRMEKEDVISRKYDQEDDADKMEFPMSKLAKAKSQRKETEKKSRKSRTDYGEELVNLRIQVWWPMDEMFYPGTVKAFDPETKKHKVLYDDDEIEILNLRKETWKPLNDGQPPQKQAADHSSPPREPIKTKEKNAKRKTVRKQHAPSSSKRIFKSGEHSSRGLGHHYVDVSSDEERRVSAKAYRRE